MDAAQLYEQVLSRNVDWLASTSGECFFQTIVRQLAQVLQVDGAMISRMTAPDQAELVSIFLRDGGVPEGEPFTSATLGEEFLRQCSIESCWGAPLQDDAGVLLGTLWILHRTPFERPELVKSISRLYAPRLALELRARGPARREPELSPVISAVPEAVVTVDVRAMVVSWNRGAEVMFGQLEADVLGHSVLEVFPEGLHSEVLREFPAIASGGPSPYFGRISTLPLVRKNGETFDAEISVTPWRQDGQLFFSAIVRDVSARRSVDQKLSNTLDQLSHVNAQLAQQLQVRDAFLATISDELRTPLTAVVGMSEALVAQPRGALSEDDRLGLGIILKSGRALQELIDDLLLFSRLTAGVTRLALRRQELGPLLVASVRQARASARAKNLELELEVGGVREVSVDGALFVSLVSGLLSNAIKFTPSGGTVRVVCSGDAQAGVVRLSVSDTGIGIAPSDFEKILEPFTQVDGGLARHYRGAGVGLCIVQRLCELHGGSLQVESRLGGGATFTIALPWSAPGTRVTPVPGVVGTPGLVLVAEANELSSKRACDYLEAMGWQTVRARTGEEAAALTQQLLPQRVLMALQLPGRDPLEVISSLRESPGLKATTFAVMTSICLPEVNERCIRAGASRCFSKPLSPVLLSDWIGVNGVL